jgi:hypothetical protein
LITPNHEIYLEKTKIADLGIWSPKRREEGIKKEEIERKAKMIWNEPLYKPKDNKRFERRTENLRQNSLREFDTPPGKSILKDTPSPVKELSVQRQPLDTHSVVPESGYFRVDEPSEYSHKNDQEKDDSLSAHNSISQEVDESIDQRDDIQETFRNRKQFRDENKTARWEQSSSKAYQNQGVYNQSPIMSAGYPPFGMLQAPAQQQMGGFLPENLVYQTPDGRIVTYKQAKVENTKNVNFEDVSVQTNTDNENRTDLGKVSNASVQSESLQNQDNQFGQAFEGNGEQFYVAQDPRAAQQDEQFYRQQYGQSRLTELYKKRQQDTLMPSMRVAQTMPQQVLQARSQQVVQTDLHQPIQKIIGERPRGGLTEYHEQPVLITQKRAIVSIEPEDIDDVPLVEGERPIPKKTFGGIQKHMLSVPFSRSSSNLVNNNLQSKEPDDIDRVSDIDYISPYAEFRNRAKYSQNTRIPSQPKIPSNRPIAPSSRSKIRYLAFFN